MSNAAAFARAPAHHFGSWIRNRVLFVLVAASSFAVASGSFLTAAPNRLAAGHTVTLWQRPAFDAALVLGLLAMLALASLLPQKRWVLIGTLAGAALMLVATLLAAGQISSLLAAGAGPAARRSLGPAFWIILSAASLAMADTLHRLQASIFAGAAVAAGLTLAIVGIALSGAFNTLSLAQEVATHRELFVAAFLRHIELVLGALLLATVCAAPLVLISLRHERARTPIFTILNLLQTIPSIALFGVLIGPLSFAATHLPLLPALGIGGIGAAPAIIALVLYSLLPLVRNATTGLAGVDSAVIESARGMGMSEREIFCQVRLPLALPVLVSAMRIVTIQAIGLTAVAALIGAGGLGTFVFQGIGQYAFDLVLVGALPIIVLALAVDLAFQMWLAALRRAA